MAPIGDYFQEAPLHCMYKFDDSAQRVVEASMMDVDWDAAAAESEKHRFLRKSVVGLSVRFPVLLVSRKGRGGLRCFLLTEPHERDFFAKYFYRRKTF